MRQTIIPAERLVRTAQQIFEAAGVPPTKAAITANGLVAANLRGVDSHGVHLLPAYVDQIEGGDVNVRADGHVISESGGCLLFDGENGLGHWVADVCCAHVTRLARQFGAGVVIARESNHFGAAAHWAQKISALGQIGIVMCNASPIVPPWGGREGRVGTNPICMSVPGGAWLLDMATTTVAAGKIYQALLNGQPRIPEGWAFDARGVPTTDAREATQGMLMPLGGYKGSGLGMMAEILCGVLGGGAMSTDVGGIRIPGRPARVSQIYVAIDVERFMSVDEFQSRMAELVTGVHTTPVAPGFDEVLVAGDPERLKEQDRRTNGIPLGLGTWESIRTTGARLGVHVPAAT
jgi:LDH2 family malate/lactate/ureidoglycolate dehydrogenase